MVNLVDCSEGQEGGCWKSDLNSVFWFSRWPEYTRGSISLDF